MSSDTIDRDELAYFVMANPDCSSIDIAHQFGVTVAKAFTQMNELIDLGLAFKTSIRSPTNNKRILGYRMIPGFDALGDNGDGSMKDAEVINLLRRRVRLEGEWSAAMMLAAHNEWRTVHHIHPIPTEAVFGAH